MKKGRQMINHIMREGRKNLDRQPRSKLESREEGSLAEVESLQNLP